MLFRQITQKIYHQLIDCFSVFFILKKLDIALFILNFIEVDKVILCFLI